MNGTNPSKEEILKICKRINAKGMAFMVHKYKYCEHGKRKNLNELKRSGALKQADGFKPYLYFYLPEYEEKVLQKEKHNA